MAIERLVDFEIPGWGEFGGAPVEIASYWERVLGMGPLGYWRLGEAGGGLVDQVTGLQASVEGDVTRGVVGALGCDPDGAIALGGVSSLVRLGRVVLPGDGASFGLCCWMRTRAVNGSAVISQYANDGGGLDPLRFGLRVLADGRLAWWKGGSYVGQTERIVNDELWHMLAVTRDGEGWVRLWVDGEEEAVFHELAGFQGTETALGGFPGVNSLAAELDEVFVTAGVVSQGALRSLYRLAVGVPDVTGGEA